MFKAKNRAPKSVAEKHIPKRAKKCKFLNHKFSENFFRNFGFWILDFGILKLFDQKFQLSLI